MLTMKFGGTSVGNAQAFLDVAQIVRETLRRDKEIVVVVSAMSGVTDSLIKAAQSATQGDEKTLEGVKQTLLHKHLEVINETIEDVGTRQELSQEIAGALEGFENLCRSILVLGELTPRALDMVSSLGERFSAKILAAILRQQGIKSQAVEATEIVITNGNHGSAHPLLDLTRERGRARLLPLLQEGVVPVVTGFIGATPEGVVTTLGRGGSDYTASILGDCLDADEIWIWTDVDGVMTADPRLVPEARTLPEISYAEAAELSYFGAKVIHPKTIIPAAERGIPLRILNTFNPQGPGTLVVKEPRPDKRTLKAITSIKDLSLLTVEGRGMIGVPGVAAKVFSTVAQEGISVLMISQSSSEQNICFVINKEVSQRALSALEKAFELELAHRNIDRIWAQDDVVIIAAVGAGMRGTPGIAAKVFGALGRRSINIISIAQGSSEYNLSLVVDKKDADDAVRYIHQEFDLGRQG